MNADIQDKKIMVYYLKNERNCGDGGKSACI
jgi:hypothetical protein